MTFGAARIRIPEDHKLGRIELPVKYTLLTFMDREGRPPTNIHRASSKCFKLGMNGMASFVTSNRQMLLYSCMGTIQASRMLLLREALIVWDLQFQGCLCSFLGRQGEAPCNTNTIESAQLRRSDFIDLLKILKKEHGKSECMFWPIVWAIMSCWTL